MEGKYAFRWTRLYLRAVPRQSGAAEIARAGLQPRHLPALDRAAQGYGRMVADQPSTQAGQDRCPRCASRPCHHLSAGRGGCN